MHADCVKKAVFFIIAHKRKTHASSRQMAEMSRERSNRRMQMMLTRRRVRDMDGGGVEGGTILTYDDPVKILQRVSKVRYVLNVGMVPYLYEYLERR